MESLAGAQCDQLSSCLASAHRWLFPAVQLEAQEEGSWEVYLRGWAGAEEVVMESQVLLCPFERRDGTMHDDRLPHALRRWAAGWKASLAANPDFAPHVRRNTVPFAMAVLHSLSRRFLTAKTSSRRREGTALNRRQSG
jgi:hypothetical protein